MSVLAAHTPDTSIMELLKAEFSGLSNTCDHFNVCAYLDFEKGTIRCEHFENESGTFTSVACPEIHKGNAAPPVGVKGICVNCERVWDCKLPKTLAGVWHCEVYE